MAVLAIFRYDVKPGRTGDFIEKLQKAAGPDTGGLILVIEYEDMAAYGARTAFENANAQWRKLFEANRIRRRGWFRWSC